MRKACTDSKECIRTWGDQNAKQIRLRVQELRAAETLADVSPMPPTRCHELGQDRKGQFAVDLKDPFRLVFEPADEPVPKLKDGGIDLSAVTAVRVLEVVNYHGK